MQKKAEAERLEEERKRKEEEEAKKKLEQHEQDGYVPSAVSLHWQSIVDGKIPFGYTIYKEE